MELLKKAKGIKIRSIVSIVLIFTLIGIIASLILCLIDGIIILSTDWNNKELDESKLLWGLLTLLILGPISSLIFSIKAEKELKSNSASE